jgi:hypothetical protein
MNRRGYTLLQTLFVAAVSPLVMLSVVMLLRTLLSVTSGKWIGDGENRYAVSPSLSEGVKATRFHLELNRVRSEADAVFVFGGTVYRPVAGGSWQYSLDHPLQKGFNVEQLLQRLRTEEEDLWFRRMAYLGGPQFFQNPVSLLGETDFESTSHLGDFTMLFLSGRHLISVVHVRCLPQEMESTVWQKWECELYNLRTGDRLVYRCAWQSDEMMEFPSPVSPFAGVEIGRFPGVRQFRVKGGVAEGGELVFAEVVFPDPMLVWSVDSQQEGTYPVSRYFYLYFFQ